MGLAAAGGDKRLRGDALASRLLCLAVVTASPATLRYVLLALLGLSLAVAAVVSP